MKKVTISIALFLGIFLSNLTFAADFDATGLWDYSEIAGSHTSCEAPETSPNHEIGILQTNDSFLFVDLFEGFSTFGSISSATYNFSDSFCEEGGGTTADVGFTLAPSATSASGNVSWTWSGPGGPCSGGHDFTLTKRSQNNPIYDASGKWNYTQSGFDDRCDPPSTPPTPSGFFQVTQTGNSVTAIDDQGLSYSGFIDGKTYNLVRTYPKDGGRTSVVYMVTLSSTNSGSGRAEFVWDDDCEDCWGQWTIAVTKEQAAKRKSHPGLPLLLLDD